MPILVGIDGTGDAVAPGTGRDAAYDLAFAQSFVRRICTGKANARYFRGPVALGGGLPEAISGGVAFVQERRRKLPLEPVLLTGYSRGAAGVVVIAKRLKTLGIAVRALMMFDCVDRHLAFDADTIPNNVQFVNHVIRNPAARSRMTFDNDGMKYTAPTVYPPAKKYMCTHGGMGGMPWKAPPGTPTTTLIDEGTLEALLSPTRHEPVWTYKTNVSYAQDDAVSRQIWRDVQPFLAKHRF